MIKDVYLAGNANVGKTSLFNNLTRSSEHIGNWHGVTVESKTKHIKYGDRALSITDLPGIYSLCVYSNEENVTRDALTGCGNSGTGCGNSGTGCGNSGTGCGNSGTGCGNSGPGCGNSGTGCGNSGPGCGSGSLILNVAEVNNLPRNLYLTAQLMELGVSFILVINMIDELKGQNKTIDYNMIERCTGVKVLPVTSKKQKYTKEVLAACAGYTEKNNPPRPPYMTKLPLDRVNAVVRDYKGLRPEYCAIKLLEKDKYIEDYLGLTVLQKDKIAALGDYADKIAEYRYEFIEDIINKSVRYNSSAKIHGQSVIDRVILNKYLALPVFFLFMGLIFLFTFGSVAGVPMPGKFLSDCLGRLMRLIFTPLTDLLIKRGAYPWITALVRDGIVGVIGGVLVFLPQVLILFLSLAFMEDTGYMSRVAFMTDGLFNKIGLSGKSSFTLLMGFGCSATAVLTSRNLEDESVRKKTVMITPFMSCGARLPVYAAIGGAYFGGNNVILILLLYISGAAAALLWAWILGQFNKLKSREPDYIMEMPPYRLPTARRVSQLLWNNTKSFIIRVVTVVFSLNIIVWILSSFSFTFVYVAENGGKSMMMAAAELIAPVFKPLGFGNWKAVAALISGLVAKESVISVLESIGGIGGGASVFESAAAALSFLTFTLLYIPCAAAMAAIYKEIGKKYLIITICMELGTAYVMSLLVYNAAVIFEKSGLVYAFAVLLLVTASLVLAGIIISLTVKKIKKRKAAQLKRN